MKKLQTMILTQNDITTVTTLVAECEYKIADEAKIAVENLEKALIEKGLEKRFASVLKDEKKTLDRIFKLLVYIATNTDEKAGE